MSLDQYFDLSPNQSETNQQFQHLTPHAGWIKLMHPDPVQLAIDELQSSYQSLSFERRDELMELIVGEQ